VELLVVVVKGVSQPGSMSAFTLEVIRLGVSVQQKIGGRSAIGCP